jgi:hypothetical protein
MSTSRRRSRRSRVRLSRVQLVCVAAGLALMVEGGRAAVVAATWWDALVVGGAVAALAVALAWPTRRRRPRSTTIYRRPATSTQRVANEVLEGGHPAWAAPAQAKQQARPKALTNQRRRLVVAEELLERHGLAADYRAVVEELESAEQ